jgi:hypothetical protein
MTTPLLIPSERHFGPPRISTWQHSRRVSREFVPVFRWILTIGIFIDNSPIRYIPYL